MKTGTKSLLFGVHQFLWHPITVVLAWHRLYKKWPDFKELICIIIHDWGYWGCENMDDEYGQFHPVTGAKLARSMFGSRYYFLCIWHSRHLAKRFEQEPSELCWADKLSIIYEPWWFYIFRARLSGELREYRAETVENGFCDGAVSDREWFFKILAFMKQQAFAQKSSDVYMGDAGKEGLR